MESAVGELGLRTASTRARPGAAWLAVEAGLAVVLLAIWAAAFVGLAASSYWIDELWTLYVADHAGGVGEVVRRALTDTHPPAYYVLIHLWTRAVGDGEAATRSLSALSAVGAGVVFLLGARPAFSRAARLFGAVAGASAIYWFDQSQNVRSYAFAMLVLTALLCLALEARRRSEAGQRVGPGVCAAIAALGLLGSFIHYYLFLCVGLVFLALLVSVADLRLRATVVVAGAAILGLAVAYMSVEKRHLIFTQLWFSNDPDSFRHAFVSATHMAIGRWAKRAMLLLAAGALYGAWARRRGGLAPPVNGRLALARWSAGVALFVAVALAAIGVAISLLVQPSFSDRNLLIAQPCLWFVAAWLFDEAVQGVPGRAGLALAGLATFLAMFELIGLRGRVLERNEDWRGSARYFESLAACRGREIPVVLPSKFGPDTPFFRQFAQRYLFGWYDHGGHRLLVESSRQLAASPDPAIVSLLGARASGADPCPVLAWGVHDIGDPEAAALAQAIGRRPEVAGRIVLHRLPSYSRVHDGWVPGWPFAYVYERPSPTRPQA